MGDVQTSGRNGFADDFRQAYVVMKNEITKYARGKKLMIFGIITVLILAVVTAALVIWGDGLGDDSNTLAYLYVMIMALLVVISVTLFTSTALVSEFEERTALILFTKPIKKWAIFVGKFAAAMIVSVGFILAYYAFLAVLCLVGPGYVTSEIGQSMALAICYTFGCAGIALLISAVMKKASTASILTFFTIMLFLNMLVSVVKLAVGLDDTWYVLSTAGDDILNVLGDSFMTNNNEAQPLRSCIVMIVWGAVASVAAFFAFRKRDF